MTTELNQALANVVTVLKQFPSAGWRGDEIARMEALLADPSAPKTEYYVALNRAIDMTKVMWHLLSEDDRRSVRYAQSELYAGIEDEGVDLDVDFDRDLRDKVEAYALRHNKSLNQVVQDALSACVSGEAFEKRL